MFLRCFQKILVVFPLYVFISFSAYAQDVSRYPEGNVFYAADIEFSMQATQGDRDLEIQVGLDSSFTEEQKKLIRKSLRIILDRCVKKTVLECSLRNSFKDLPESPNIFEAQILSAFSILSFGQNFKIPSFIFIARYSNDHKTVGLGYVNSFYDEDKPFPGQSNRHYLHIALNSDHLGEYASSGYIYRSNVEYWAGVIAHEFLHNLGYIHPGGLKGSFISEYANCIRRNGADGADLEGALPDIEIEKEY